MARFRLTPQAETQIGKLVEFISTERENAALRVRDALYDAFELLAAHWALDTREDLTPHAVKVWSVSSFLVVYNPRSEPMNSLRSCTVHAMPNGCWGARAVTRPDSDVIINFDELLTAALERDTFNRMRLAERLLASLDTSWPLENERAWAEEAQRRAEQHGSRNTAEPSR